MDVLITLNPDTLIETFIHEELVKNSKLKGHGQKVGRFHMTMAWIKGVHPADQTRLKELLQRALSGQHLKVTMNYVDRYMVGESIALNKRTFHNSPLVIYPKYQEAVNLKRLNKELHHLVFEFNKSHNTSYVFMEDVLPQNFRPHMTLANTKDVNELIKKSCDVNIDRDTIIYDLNLIIKNINRVEPFILYESH